MRRWFWGLTRAGPYKPTPPDKPLRFASVMVIAVLVYLALFTAAALAIFAITGNEPATLIAGVFGVAGTELMSAAGIRIFGKKKEGDNENAG